MQKIADIWYVSFQELVNQCGICTDTIKQGMARGSAGWQATPDPTDGRKRLICYDTMSPKYQAIVRRVLCGGYQPSEKPAEKNTVVLSERSLVDMLEGACTDGFRRNLGLYVVQTGDNRYNQKRVLCLARGAAVVEAIGQYILDRQLGWKTYAPFDEACQWITTNRQNYFHWKDVPTNRVRLKEKVMALMVERKPITEIVHLPREDNNNREQFVHKYPQPLAWAMQMATLGENYSDAFIIRKVTECCEQYSVPTPSASWFSNIFAQPATKRLRSGHRWEPGSRQAQKYTAYRPIEGALHAGDCWMMDGTRVNILPHATEDHKEKYLYIVIVYDVYSGDVLGQTWGYGEDRWQYINALKMAVATSGYVPYELVTDKFSGHKSPEWEGIMEQLKPLGLRHTITIDPQGKAPAERFFGTFQDVFLQESKYYYGQGVQSKRAAAHRTGTYLMETQKEARREGWNFDQAWREANHWLQSYRQTPLSYYSKKNIDLCPRDRHDQSDKPLVSLLRPEQVVQLFWLKKDLSISREMVKMTVLKQEVFYPFTSQMYGTLRHYNRVTVRYDETDLTGVHLFDPRTDQYLGYLEQGELTTRYGVANPLQDEQRQHFVKEQQIMRDYDQAELDQLRGGADDVVQLTMKRQPKALRELAEDHYQAERVTADRAARQPQKKPPKPVADTFTLDDLDALTRDRYRPQN